MQKESVGSVLRIMLKEQKTFLAEAASAVKGTWGKSGFLSAESLQGRIKDSAILVTINDILFDLPWTEDMTDARVGVKFDRAGRLMVIYPADVSIGKFKKFTPKYKKLILKVFASPDIWCK